MVKHYNHKKRMLRVAEPIINIFLSEQSLKKRRDVLRKIVGKTRGMTKDEFKESYKNFLKNKGFTRAFYDPLSRENVFSKSAKSYDYGHELMHNLRRYTKNDYVLASAVETYMRSLDQARVYIEEDRINETEDLYKKIRHQENLKPLSFLHRILNQEYSNKFDETGRDIGRRAAFMEARYKLPGAGLQYLKLIDNKVSPEKAEKIVIMMNEQNLSLV